MAARHALDSVAPLRLMVAAELLTAVRLLGPTRPAALAGVVEAVHDAAPRLADRADQDLTAALEALACVVPGLVDLLRPTSQE